MPKRPATPMIEEEFGRPQPVLPSAPIPVDPIPTETAQPDSPRKRGGKPQE